VAGKLVGSKKVEGVEEELVAMMVGRQIANLYGDRTGRVLGEAYFKVEGLGRKRRFSGISFELHQGEILGMAGLVGARRTEIGRSIFGADPVDTGHIILNGAELTVRTRDAIREDCYLTEDRKAQGLF
jgi:ABC-type sugar transport system ATPase subunit